MSTVTHRHREGAGAAAVERAPQAEGRSLPIPMFKDYWKYDWVLPAYRYENINSLLVTLPEKLLFLQRRR